MRTADLGACPSCHVSPNALIWEPILEPAARQVSEIIAIPSSDDEDTDDEEEQPSPAKKRRQDKECVICFEKETRQDKLLTTTCCIQSAHVSCLRPYYELPPCCTTLQQRKTLANNLGIPSCFVCRGDSDGSIVGLDIKLVRKLLPEVKSRFDLWGVKEANDLMVIWTAMFDDHIDKVSREWKHFMRIEDAVAYCTRLDGTQERTWLGSSKKHQRISWLRADLKSRIVKAVHEWAGLAKPAAVFTEYTIGNFRLHDVVEVAVSLRLAQFCYQTYALGGGAPPFKTGSRLDHLSTWKVVGHVFDFDDVFVTRVNKFTDWHFELIE